MNRKEEKMVTEDIVYSFNVELIEKECDHARVEPSNEEEQNVELPDLIGDDSMAENEENTDTVHNEVDADFNLSNEVAACPETVSNVTESGANVSYENIEVENAEELSLRGIVRMRFEVDKNSAYEEENLILPPFMCRKLPFHLFLTTCIRDNDEKVAIYLKRGVPDGYDMPQVNRYPDESSLEIALSAIIGLVDHTSGLTIEKSFENHLFRDKTDWGYSDFISLKEIDVSHSFTIFVNITASPPFFFNYNSKAVTGYVGIKNQGATCYINSLLEVLFFLTKFRTACYRIPTEMDDCSSMALALQKVFYNLQYSNLPVYTINLTKSFGWSTVDALMQHDIQELMRVLIEKIESRMKHTLLENIVPSMFQGAFISYVKCRDVEFTSQRKEIFYDIQLSLENASNVYEAFKQYVSPEIMDNDNKYDAGSFGLQTAEKGTFFTNLPSVLFLHLLRFQFDANLNMAIKNNNFFEFYDHIDLTEFVQSDESKPSKYTLFAVLAHSGGGSHGHYVAYINPALDGNWLKFNDDIISLVHPYDAINENFGINCKDEWTKSQQSNAYMLLYIRDCDAHEILEPVDPKYISDELIISLKTEPVHEDNIDWNVNDDVYVFLDSHLESEIRFDATKFVRSPIIDVLPKFNIPTDTTTSKFKSTLKASFMISNDNQLRIWPIYHSSTISYPFYINNNDSFVLSEFKDKHQTPHAAWVEIALPGFELPSFDPQNDVLIFYYFYCGSRCRSYYIDHGYHDRTSKVAELVPILNGMMKWTNQELNIYEDCGGAHIRELIMSDYLMNGIFPRCSTFVMNIVFEPKEHDTSVSALPSIYMYFKDIRSRVTLTFWNADDHNDNEIFLFVSINTTFPTLRDILATKLNYDREKIQIFASYGGHLRDEAIPSTSTETLSTLINCSNQQDRLMFYKLLPVNVIDAETKIPFHFRWLSIDMKKMQDLTLYITNDDSFENILAEAQKLVQPDLTYGSGTYRLLRVKDNKLKILNETKQILLYLKHINNRNYFRLEEIPMGDNLVNLNEMNVTVFHFSIAKKTKAFSGHPFLFKIALNEQWQNIKERIRIRLAISKTMWLDYRPLIFESKDLDQELAMKDMECINDIDPNTVKKYIIRLDHSNKTNEEGNYIKFLEKSITISD